MEERITILGGGFAGVEAAWAAAQRGVCVRLIEMRPETMTPAHKSGLLCELVCSNSFKSALPDSPSGELKAEMEMLGSLVIPVARQFAVPAGEALAVDREQFASEITRRIEAHPLIEVLRTEAAEIPADRPLVIATGPLTSDRLCQAIGRLTGRQHLYFYDAVSPTVEASSLDHSVVFPQSRYDKSGGDYLNCPMTEDQYEAFVDALLTAEQVPLHDFEQPQYFEGCLPIEEIARRGRRSLAFGNFKPVGLTNPGSSDRLYAVVQLRPENLDKTLYSLVGCQTRMKWGEQRRVFRMIPGLEQAEFVRYGVIHRNTYLDSPRLLFPTLQFRRDDGLFFAGQLVGVEGYIESAAAGIVAGINAARMVRGCGPVTPPRESMIGALLDYVASCPAKEFAPMNANWGLLPDPEPPIRDKQQRRMAKLGAARDAIRQFVREELGEI
ncbi:MAG: methylenetetrahydrofolate--tRNA-(uracil(54)-C(5))-methyltransferase (FADH(2)-oxidizing) TrmFO [Fimbriimonadia bacterium]|jgi:methylenetetrahydrofolate--tRNA-(uracil-5-)-methyltransferase